MSSSFQTAVKLHFSFSSSTACDPFALQIISANDETFFTVESLTGLIKRSDEHVHRNKHVDREYQ